MATGYCIGWQRYKAASSTQKPISFSILVRTPIGPLLPLRDSVP